MRGVSLPSYFLCDFRSYKKLEARLRRGTVPLSNHIKTQMAKPCVLIKKGNIKNPVYLTSGIFCNILHFLKNISPKKRLLSLEYQSFHNKIKTLRIFSFCAMFRPHRLKKSTYRFLKWFTIMLPVY